MGTVSAQRDDTEWLTSSEAADYLGYKRPYLYQLIAAGVGIPHKRVGRGRGTLRFSVSELDRWINNRSTGKETQSGSDVNGTPE
jgi:excisionase family DNA binding protein